MQQGPDNTVYWVIVMLTIGCGFAAVMSAVFTDTNGSSQNMDHFFNTCTHLFSAGIGAIFGVQALRATNRAVFWTIVVLTVFCGFAAGGTAVYTAINGASPNMNQLYSTMTHLFSGGVGAIFGSNVNRWRAS